MINFELIDLVAKSRIAGYTEKEIYTAVNLGLKNYNVYIRKSKEKINKK